MCSGFIYANSQCFGCDATFPSNELKKNHTCHSLLDKHFVVSETKKRPSAPKNFDFETDSTSSSPKKKAKGDTKVGQEQHK